MTSSPQSTVDLVWKRVLFFLFSVPQPPPLSPTFHRLGLPYLYQCPSLANRAAIQALGERLHADPSVRLHVRELIVYYHADGTDAPTKPGLRHTPRLTRLVKVSMDWPTLQAHAETAGTSLVELKAHLIAGEVATVVVDPSVLRYFTARRILDWSIKEVDFLLTAVGWSAHDESPALEVLKADVTTYTLLTQLDYVAPKYPSH
ncbi:hypothetical protein B0H13DRAFT_2368920 [Mycena leptocephala]|nr:hypothetical protein B0H13DRAFT_2368920 [Mycena leptocephala]